jgi:hypothetical protein
MSIYVVLFLYHLVRALNGQKYWKSTIVTFVFLTFLFTTCDYNNQHDLSAYSIEYNYYDPVLDENFNFYYIFFSLMKLGQVLRLTFETWWTLMMAGAMFIVFIALRIHQFNPHVFLCAFMAYYGIMMYAGIKSFCGWTVFLLACGFLYRGGKKNKIIYIILTCVAGGIHVMYYMYLIFAFVNTGTEQIVLYNENDSDSSVNKNMKTYNKLLPYVVIISLTLTILMRVSGTANHYVGGLLSAFNSDKLESYASLTTNMGFFIPVIMQILSLYLAYKHRYYSKVCGELRQNYAQIIYSTNLLQILFYPFFMISTTFMRFITEYSLVTIAAIGYEFDDFIMHERKRLLLCVSLLIVAYYYRQFIMGNLWDISVVPLFTNKYIHI